ncbi:hypothetical protein [Rhodohalobacter mucosus]|uniref:Uncharacterized protein n=1 Tax=Rhodohalobacter mucosus TaxID=2079485 RepID=A0A316TLE5_9BACT|nr:hypothetical protein [Rhodohalobacter mucosus]PWN05403.1 hypothetical protein DDZ15_15160 [Rhodohalobacter mucosus]
MKETNLRITHIIGLIWIMIAGFACNDSEPELDGSNSAETSVEGTSPVETDESDYYLTHKEELVFIFASSRSTCPACEDAELSELINDIKTKIQDRSRELGIGFTSIGIAVDWSPETGIDHLRNISIFDEMIVGRNWYNTGMIKYTFSEFPGRRGLPQIIITKRVYSGEMNPDRGVISGYNGIESDVELHRVFGPPAFARWNRDGLPFSREID